MEHFCVKHGIRLKETKDFGRGVYVSTNQIKAGTIIWNESPISYALKQCVCHYCWKKPQQTQLYRCGNCKFARYCSKICQSKDWKQSHKIRCKSISKLNGKIPTVTIVSIGELLLNIQPHSKYDELYELQYSLISILKHHYDNKTDEEKTDMNQVSLCIALYMKSLHETLKNKNIKNNKIESDEFKIDINQINLTLGKFSTNAISICDDEFNTLGIGLFPLLSMINHHCNPNVMIKFNPCTKTAEIRALRDINKDEQLFINYTDVTVPKFMRHQALLKDYCFQCKCSFCCNHKNEQKCIDLCCKKCGNVLDANLMNIYQCNNNQCKRKYDKHKLREIVDEVESQYYEIKKNMDNIQGMEYGDNMQQKQIKLLKQCDECLLRIHKIVGKYHWLRIAIIKIMEKLQLDLNDYNNCYKSNVFILQFYEIWLSEYSPYLGIQYCLTGKLLNYLIHDQCNDIYTNNQQINGIDDDELMMTKKKELFDLCVRACKLFENGLKILRISHGDTPFIKQLIECQQTAQFNLQNVSKY